MFYRTTHEFTTVMAAQIDSLTERSLAAIIAGFADLARLDNITPFIRALNTAKNETPNKHARTVSLMTNDRDNFVQTLVMSQEKYLKEIAEKLSASSRKILLAGLKKIPGLNNALVTHELKSPDVKKTQRVYVTQSRAALFTPRTVTRCTKHNAVRNNTVTPKVGH